MAALAVTVAAIYGQVTVNDIVLARYTADAWRGRVYAVRYFLAVHQRRRRHRHDLAWLLRAAAASTWCWRPIAGIALAMFMATVLGSCSWSPVSRRAEVGAAAGGIIQNSGGIRSSTLTRMRFFTSAAMRLRWHSFGSRS